MARFRAWIDGRRKNPASRLGDETVLAEVTGDQVGIFAEARIDPEGRDVIDLYATRGRARREEPPSPLGTVYLDHGEPRFKINHATLLREEDR